MTDVEKAVIAKNGRWEKGDALRKKDTWSWRTWRLKGRLKRMAGFDLIENLRSQADLELIFLFRPSVGDGRIQTASGCGKTRMCWNTARSARGWAKTITGLTLRQSVLHGKRRSGKVYKERWASEPSGHGVYKSFFLCYYYVSFKHFYCFF